MYHANQEEQKILEFWEKDKTFEKSVQQRLEDKPYVFYDGPPFATGLPHYGHILASVIKDVVPRYSTMKGYRVRRRWGWDCHGLPIENIVEKELKISGKRDIENKIGVAKFNATCRSRVLTYTHEWKKMVTRIGRWVEFDDAYKTMDSTYMESVWWALKKIWDKGLIYEGRKVLMYCPRCETPVSKAEVAMDDSYKDVTEEAVTVKFKVRGPREKTKALRLPENTYLLAWTTTPWTLPGNVALAVGKGIRYWVLNIENENYLVAAERAQAVAGGRKYKKAGELTGADLVGLEYEPLFAIPAVKDSGKKAWYVADADFVTTAEGTGVVHTAVIYGEDDYSLGVKIGLPLVPLLDEKGHFNSDAPELIRGQYFKKAEPAIKDDLARRGLVFSQADITHSYPHCWRCDTQLFYNAIAAWFIDIQKIKPRLIELNQKVNWFPEHLKNGRFLNILETAPDWNISRNRYWATPLPFWKCSAGHSPQSRGVEGAVSCENVVCIGSVAELKTEAINFNDAFKTDRVEELDLHKHIIDKIKLKCKKCGGEMNRIPEVIDCWVESASMPFAEWHYPFENQATFEKRFPGQYIAEYIAQTRAWFYYMHVMSTLLFDNVSFENCVTTGTILNEKGEKLSKSKKNYPDPWVLIEKYGVDTLRYYLMTSVVMEADDLLFNEREIREIYNKVINILWNVAEFFGLYVGDGLWKMDHGARSTHILDQWILAKLKLLVAEVTAQMDAYNTVKAGRPIRDFIDDLSTWYLRRSRDRFKGADKNDKQAALATLRSVLMTLAKLMAPFMPFIAEKIWQTVNEGGRDKVKGEKGEWGKSVHLQEWPEATLLDHRDRVVLEEMAVARTMVEMGLALRAEHKLKVRQPLLEFRINRDALKHEVAQIIAEELNVKKVSFAEAVVEPGWGEKRAGAFAVWLNTTLTPELKKEGLLRELIRTINQLRKDQGLTVQDRVTLAYATEDPELKSIFQDYALEIVAAVLADRLEFNSAVSGETMTVGNKAITIALKK